MLRYGDVKLIPEFRQLMLNAATAEVREGDILFFYHRTSWRSRWIRRITGCDMPHACIYLGDGKIIGMLRGRVCRHFLRRFFKAGYDLRFVRGSARVKAEALKFLGRRESWLDLAAIGALVLLERATGLPMRRLIPYRMRGVTCSGVVSSAWHLAHRREHPLDTSKHTPRDLERAVSGEAETFLDASLFSPEPV